MFVVWADMYFKGYYIDKRYSLQEDCVQVTHIIRFQKKNIFQYMCNFCNSPQHPQFNRATSRALFIQVNKWAPKLTSTQIPKFGL